MVQALKQKKLLTFDLKEEATQERTLSIVLSDHPETLIAPNLVMQHMLQTVIEELKQMPLWNGKICLACPGNSIILCIHIYYHTCMHTCFHSCMHTCFCTCICVLICV